MSLIRLILIFFVVSASFASHAQLNGNLRKNFINSFYASCLKSSIENPDNKDVPARKVMQFCACRAHHTADILTNEVVIAVETGRLAQSAITKFSPVAEKYCAANYSQY